MEAFLEELAKLALAFDCAACRVTVPIAFDELCIGDYDTSGSCEAGDYEGVAKMGLGVGMPIPVADF